MGTIEMYPFWSQFIIIGNVFYFTSAIILAFALKDDRAFCKYLCPITVILKLTSRFSFLKIAEDKKTCTKWGKCTKNCPMNIDIMEYVKQDKRVLSTECIFCLTCTTACLENILDSTFRLDIGGQELFTRR